MAGGWSRDQHRLRAIPSILASVESLSLVLVDHEACRIAPGPRHDPGQPRPSVDQCPCDEDDVADDKGKKNGQGANGAGVLERDGKKLVAVCENFGLKTPSSWPKNLLAEPKARIEVDGRSADYMARIATEDEVAHNMPKLVAMWPAHDTYFCPRHVLAALRYAQRLRLRACRAGLNDEAQ